MTFVPPLKKTNSLIGEIKAAYPFYLRGDSTNIINFLCQEAKKNTYWPSMGP